MKFQEVKELIELINQSDLTEFKMKNGEFELSIRTKDYQKLKPQPVVQAQQSFIPFQSASGTAVHQAYPPPAPQPTQHMGEALEIKDESKEGKAGEEHLVAIKSPMIGTFYRSSAPDKPSYIKVGDVIEEGSVVCIIEAMKLFNEIESEVHGKIVKVEVEDASPVEYDQVLFLVDPNG